MSVRLVFVVVTLALMMCYCEANSVCKREVTKRIMSGIGIDADKMPCFIKTQRDIEDFLDAVYDDMVNGAEKRGYGPYDGQYCCSPTCDRYMAHMKIKPKFVEC